MARHLLLLIVLGLSCWQLAWAGDLERGTRAFENGDYTTARQELEPLAQAGNGQAQYVLGFMHALGRGYPQDFVVAHKWLDVAARGGNADAPQARDQIATRMTYAQLREAEALADAFRPTTTANGGATGGSSWSSAPETLPTGRALVREVQSGLAQLGFDPGPPDGLMGTRTRNAIMDFQRQIGRPVNGDASQALLQDLRAAKHQGLRAEGSRTRAAPRVRKTAQGWYFAKQDLDSVMSELARLLNHNDESLRAGVRQLTVRGRWPWTRVAVRDDFNNDATQGGLDWRVVRGEYAIRDGLVSDARRQQVRAAPESTEEQIIDLIGTLLGGKLNRDRAQTSTASTQQQGPDEIQLAIESSDRFLLRTALWVHDATRGMTLVLKGHTDTAPHEFRLRYHAGEQMMILEHVTRSGIRRIVSKPIRLDAGRSYNVEWAHRAKGLIQIAINGQLFIDNVYSDLRGNFDHLVWRNSGGHYVMQSVELHTRPHR